MLGATFLYAGITKAWADQQFAMVLVPFTIFPPEWLGTLALTLALMEIVAGLLILLPHGHAAGAALIALLLMAFIAILTWALANGIIVACGCFGAEEAPSAFKMLISIVRDLGFLLLAIVALMIPRASGRK